MAGLRKSADYQKNIELLRGLGFSEEELARREKQPGWQVLLRTRPSELKKMIEYLKRVLPKEEARRLLGRLAHPSFQKECKRRKRRPVPTPKELYYAVMGAKELAKKWHLPEEKVLDFAVRYMDHLLFLRYLEATKVIARRFLGKKFDFLLQYGFRENDILILLRTKRGSEWLRKMNPQRFQRFKETLSNYKLDSLFPALLRADLYGKFAMKKPTELRSKIERILATGRHYDLDEEKVKAILRRSPHILTSHWFDFGRYLRLSLKRKPSMKNRPKKKSPRPGQKRPRPR
ncbi:MAG: hypothetical protein J7L44_00415 [Candidatus Diapherotrites archaeon]|nr:hypothetical protein [Candidatus Diapherotrites archaeon]